MHANADIDRLSAYACQMVRVTLLMTLASCGTSVIASTPRQITYDHADKDELTDLSVKAQAYCEKYNRDAQRADSDDGNEMTFHCIDRPAEPVTVAVPEPAPRPTQPRKIIEGDAPVVCIANDGKAINYGGCFMTVEACEKFRAMNPTSTPCEQRDSAACFNSTSAVSGGRSAVCFQTIAACEQVLTAERSNPDMTALSSQCGIYRQRKE